MTKTWVPKTGLAAATLALAVISITDAEAHARLIASAPAANAVGAAPAEINLRFNEPLEAKFSQVDLKGPAGAKWKLPATIAGQDRKSLVVKAPTAMSPGVYSASWRIVGKDGHVMKGSYKFTVR